MGLTSAQHFSKIQAYPTWVCLKMRCTGREVCLRGLFRGSVSPKSNFPALIEVGHPKKNQTHISLPWQHLGPLLKVKHYLVGYIENPTELKGAKGIRGSPIRCAKLLYTWE